MQSRRRFLLTLASLPVVIAACGGSGTTTAPTAAVTPTNPAPTAAATATSPAPTAASAASGANQSAVQLLNVSYDPTRELYQEFNDVFAANWKSQSGQVVTIKQSHGSSGAQARAVTSGLEADVVTLALQPDVDAVQKAGLITGDWKSRLANNSSPYTSTIIFLVRKGNPKGIKDWPDVAKPGVGVITPNPKTSGGARWNYLAAWGYQLKASKGDDAAARAFVAQVYKNALVLDSASRASTTTFTERGIGDVLLSWENEALLAVRDLGPDKYELVVPSMSILAEPPVAVVDKNVDKHGTRAVAEAYLQYLYTDTGQDLAAKHYYRPRQAAIAAKYQSTFPKLDLFSIDDTFGGWSKVQTAHFGDGGIFDQIYQPGH
jgi:sulfate transport system substrate-binding protein